MPSHHHHGNGYEQRREQQRRAGCRHAEDEGEGVAELLEQPLLANPRNAAAGSVRQQDPKVAAARKLDIIIFNLQFDSDRTFATHTETLDYLASLGFPVVPYQRCETLDACCARIDWIGDNRETFPFDIDGAVIKINDLAQRQYLGSTAKFPRWAVAYKYPPEKKESRVRDIVVQVGRTGVLTPKAVIEPVRLAGTTVTNATLHNQDFIDNLDLRIGDTVLVQKAGEIIPEILSVVRDKRPEGTVPFHMPDTCPECYTLRDFAQEYDRGTYIVALSGHVVCVEDGTIWDSWDSGGEVPLYYWVKED